MTSPKELRLPLDEPNVLAWTGRLLWVICVGVYLTVFLSGVFAGASDLNSMLRATGFTLAAAVLGRLLLSVLGKATQAAEQPPMAVQDGTVGSLVDLVSSPNVAKPEDKAEAA